MLRFLIVLLLLVGGTGSGRSTEERPVEDASLAVHAKPARPELPTLFIVGDSTVGVVSPGSVVGWGQRLAPLFDETKINVVNRAIGGRSSRTFLTEGRWERVLADLKSGDVVLVQFGHNDAAGKVGDPAALGRPSLPGTGDETVEDAKADGSRETVHTFGWYMGRYARDAKSRGATIILCSPIPHKQNWAAERDWADQAAWDERVAREQGGQFLDLTMVITRAYRRLGRGEVEKLFVGGGHTNDAGARFNAACVVAGLRTLPADPLLPYLSAAGKAVPPDLTSASAR